MLSRLFFVLLVAFSGMAVAQDLSGWRLLLVSQLQDAGHKVVVGDHKPNPFGETEVVIAYLAPERVVTAMVKMVPDGDYRPDWVANRYAGTAEAVRRGNLALMLIGSRSEDPAAQLLKTAFAGDEPNPNRPAKIALPSKASDEAVQNRHWFKRWVESAPNRMVSGVFALNFVSSQGSALEDLAAGLRKAGLTVKWSISEDRGEKSYWVHALVADVWGPDQLTARLDALRLESYDGYGKAFFNTGWEPAEAGANNEALFPTGSFVLYDERPR